jgi:ABC-type multidrug transport system fused ATPase/permease subunit
MTDLTGAINGLAGTVDISCEAPDNKTNTATCYFKQSVLQQLFGSSGLSLDACTFGECVRQSVIDEAGNSTDSTSNGSGGHSLSGGVIAGLAVVGGLLLLALLLLALGLVKQRRARRSGLGGTGKTGGVGVDWVDINYDIPRSSGLMGRFRELGSNTNKGDVIMDDHVLGGISGRVKPGEMMAILGPSGE